MNDLTIKEVSKDRTYTTYMVEGLSVEEMNYILSGNGDGKDIDDRLCDTMEAHGYVSVAKCWKCGYGIYTVRHFGGDLLVNVGSSCD